MEQVKIGKRNKFGYYLIDGEPFMSVTTIVKKVLGWEEGGIYGFWCKLGWTEAIRVRNASASYGTKLHKAFYKHFFHDEPIDSEYFNRSQQVWKWLSENKFELEKGEFEVYNKKYKYAGQSDGLMKREGKYYLIDWKTGKQRDFEETIQLGAYAKGDNVPEIEGAYDIYVGKNDGETIKPVLRKKEELNEGYNTLVHMVEILNTKKILSKLRRKK